MSRVSKDVGRKQGDVFKHNGIWYRMGPKASKKCCTVETLNGEHCPNEARTGGICCYHLSNPRTHLSNRENLDGKLPGEVIETNGQLFGMSGINKVKLCSQVDDGVMCPRIATFKGYCTIHNSNCDDNQDPVTVVYRNINECYFGLGVVKRSSKPEVNVNEIILLNECVFTDKNQIIAKRPSGKCPESINDLSKCADVIYAFNYVFPGKKIYADGMNALMIVNDNVKLAASISSDPIEGFTVFTPDNPDRLLDDLRQMQTCASFDLSPMKSVLDSLGITYTIAISIYICISMNVYGECRIGFNEKFDGMSLTFEEASSKEKITMRFANLAKK